MHISFSFFNWFKINCAEQYVYNVLSRLQIQKCNIFENSTTKEWEQSCVEGKKIINHYKMQIHKIVREM